MLRLKTTNNTQGSRFNPAAVDTRVLADNSIGGAAIADGAITNGAWRNDGSCFFCWTAQANERIFS
jgi:hypothetical protein